MSDIIAQLPENPDAGNQDKEIQHQENQRRRSAVSLGAALVIHVAALALAALLIATAPGATPAPPMSVDLQLASAPTLSDQVSTAASAASVAGPVAATSASGPASAADSSGFVIPTPRAPAAAATAPAGSGSSFREAGGAAGGAASLPAQPSPLPGPAVPAQQSGKAAGTGTGTAQHGGQGVAVTAPSAAGGANGTLDLSGLDKTRSGSGGTGSTRAATGGSGAGSAGGSAAQGGASSGGTVVGPDYQVVWDPQNASKGRKVTKSVTPKIPAWVAKQGLNLSVSVSFTLGPDGVVSAVLVNPSSGYADVDSAVVDAIRRWRFTAAPGAAPIKGKIPFEITSR